MFSLVFLLFLSYVFTRETVPLVYNALLMEPLILNLEDLFITGFIAEQLGIPRVRLRDFNSHRLPHKPVCTSVVYFHFYQHRNLTQFAHGNHATRTT